MAVIKSLDSLRASKLLGILDYYYWKGLLCVRVLPTQVHQPGTPSQLQTWNALKSGKTDWRILTNFDKAAYANLTANIPRTGHDWYIKGYLLTYAQLHLTTPAIYNIDHFAAGPWNVITCHTTQLATPQLLYGNTNQPLPSAFTHWQPSTYYTRGARFRRRWKLLLSFPNVLGGMPPAPALHHNWVIPGPPPGGRTDCMIALLAPPDTTTQLTSGIFYIT